MPATPLETGVPALQSKRSHQESSAAEAVLPNNQHSQSATTDTEEPSDDLDLTVSFLGCPSNSTRLLASFSDSWNDEPQIDETVKNKPAIVNFKSTTDFFKPIFVWEQIQGRNNNQQSDSKEEETASDQDNDSSAASEEQREYIRSRQTNRGRSRERGGPNSDITTLSRKGSGIQKSDQVASLCGKSIVSISRGSLREIKSSKTSITEEGSAGQQTRKSSAPLTGAGGRTQNTRMHRSPPQRKKFYAQGSSAPAPFMPTSAQSSSGCTDISRASSVSPSSKEFFAKNGAQRPSSALDNLVKGTNTRHRENTDCASAVSDRRRHIPAKQPSSSYGASNLRRNETSKAPYQSSAESDLRERRRGSSQSSPRTARADPYQVRCQLILPDEPWRTGAPHGDIEQTSPQKARQRFIETQKRKTLSGSKTRNQSPLQPNSPSDIKTPKSEVSVTPWDKIDNITGKKGGKDAKQTSLSSSTGMITGQNSSRSRSSRRHPVLDKMFRHILASLVMESGPPSSACLASVLDQVEGGGTSDSIRSQSRTSSSVSNTDSFASRLSKYRRKGNHGAQSDLKDDTMPLSNSLPCTLQKINEEPKA